MERYQWLIGIVGVVGAALYYYTQDEMTSWTGHAAYIPGDGCVIEVQEEPFLSSDLAWCKRMMDQHH